MTEFLSAAYGSVSDIEIAWCLIAAVGLFFSTFNVIDAKGDLNFLNSNHIGNGRVKLGRVNFLSETTRAIKQGIFLLIGFLAFFLPEAPDSLNLPTTQVVLRITVTWGIILASLLTTFQSYLSFRIRRQLKSGRSQ